MVDGTIQVGRKGIKRGDGLEEAREENEAYDSYFGNFFFLPYKYRMLISFCFFSSIALSFGYV